MPYVNIRYMVAVFGLLEPSDVMKEMNGGLAIAPPLTMNPAQQLVAAYMLGIDLAEMLEPSWIGFEVLATHSVKCAIAASMAVERSSRPSLKETLQHVGFRLDKNATSDAVTEEWNKMDNFQAVCVPPNRDQEPTVFHTKTRQMRVGLNMMSDTKALQVDKLLHETLSAFGVNFDKRKRKTFSPPVACTNYGNSSLPDGYVTFVVEDKKASKKTASKKEASKRLQKWTIMIQAKDYHGSSINAASLNKHAENACTPLLNGIFGENRLLCVASSDGSIESSRKASERNFLPFHVQKSDLFKALLKQLKEQRSEKTRIQTYACFCNEGGGLVEDEETKDSSKSKRRRTQ